MKFVPKMIIILIELEMRLSIKSYKSFICINSLYICLYTRMVLKYFQLVSRFTSDVLKLKLFVDTTLVGEM